MTNIVTKAPKPTRKFWVKKHPIFDRCKLYTGLFENDKPTEKPILLCKNMTKAEADNEVFLLQRGVKHFRSFLK